MDPKTANLDPKLKEAYDRIMGTSVPVTNKTTTPQAATKPEETVQSQTPKMQVQEVAPEPLSVQSTQPPTVSPPIVHPITPPHEIIQTPQITNPVTAKTVNTQTQSYTKKNNKFTTILLLFAGIIFLVAYTLVWAKVFSLF